MTTAPTDSKIAETADAVGIRSSALFGIWITDADGSNGRWMSDTNNGKDRWETASRFDAACAAGERRCIYSLNYEVMEIPPNDQGDS